MIAIIILGAVILILAGFAVKLNYVLGGGYREDKLESHEEMMNWFKQKLEEQEKYEQAQMMDYLEERYHEKFVMKSYIRNLKKQGGYSQMEAWPEGKEDDWHLFEVYGYLGEGGTHGL